MPASPRTTSLGACAACGAYGNSQHLPTCNPARTPRLRPRLSLARQARPDPRRLLAFTTYQRVRTSRFDEL